MDFFYTTLVLLLARVGNRNFIRDVVNGLEIAYNLLNWPTSLFCWGDYAEYYDCLADGTKVRHEYQDGSCLLPDGQRVR